MQLFVMIEFGHIELFCVPGCKIHLVGSANRRHETDYLNTEQNDEATKAEEEEEEKWNKERYI